MKQKIVTGLLLLVVFLSAGCGNKEKISNDNNNTNTEKINYNGIYNLDDTKIKIYSENDKIYYVVENNGLHIRSYTKANNIIMLDSVSDKTKLTFKKDLVVIKTDNEDLKEGKYEFTEPYSKEDFYSDFYGDKEYSNAEINGIYTNEKVKVYVYQKSEKAIRLYCQENNHGMDYEIDLTENNTYHLDFFDTTFDVSFNDNTMTISVESEDDDYKVLNGTFTKKSKLELDDIIKNISAS